MPIVPEDKNWIWVLERACSECGIDAAAIDVTQTPTVVREIAARWQPVLKRPTATERANDDRWSDLEYACHVRDILSIYDMRLNRMLNEDGPHYENWDPDQASLDGKYTDQDPAQVATAIATLGEQIAKSFERVRPNDWERTGFRGDGIAFTIKTFAQYFLHDPLHHLWDVKG
jgi:hypothetical protein